MVAHYKMTSARVIAAAVWCMEGLSVQVVWSDSEIVSSICQTDLSNLYNYASDSSLQPSYSTICSVSCRCYFLPCFLHTYITLLNPHNQIPLIVCGLTSACTVFSSDLVEVI